MVELNYDKLFTWTAENDKEMSAQLGVYKGRASITIFKARQILAKIPLDIYGRYLIIKYLKQAMANGPNTNVVYPIQKYQFEEKKVITIGDLVFGRTDKNIVYMGLRAPGLSATKFPFKVSIAWSSSDDEVAKAELAAGTFLMVMTDDLPNAIANTSEKPMPPGQRQGGGQGGGATAGSGGGSYGGDIF